MNEHWARLARQVPGGFGGLFFDRRGRVTIYLVDPSQRDAAIAALRRLLAEPPFSGGQPVDLTNVRVLKGDYDFAQLKDYHDRTKLIEGGVNGITASGISHGENRVFLGVLSEDVRRQMAERVGSLGIPCGAILINIVKPAIMG